MVSSNDLRSLKRALGRVVVGLEPHFVLPTWRRKLIAKLSRGMWSVTGTRRSADDPEWLTVTGWIAPTDPDAEVALLVDGQPVDQFQYGGETTSLVASFPYLPNSDRLGFVAAHRITHGAPSVELSAVDRRTGQPLGEWQSVFVPLQTDSRLFPDATRRARVHGSTDLNTFQLEGFSTYEKLKRALRATVGKSLADFDQILDWGCGCGRLTRYLSVGGGETCVTAADIDSDNLEWCRQNLPAIRCVELDLNPPSAFPAATFDLVLGVSVFTHLDELTQHQWLSELRRITTDGAVLAVTIHGPACHAMSGSAALARQIDKRGILDGPSLDLAGVIADGYYRTTFHSHDYVTSSWSKYFEIVNILPTCIAGHQDLVVMRRRTARTDLERCSVPHGK